MSRRKCMMFLASPPTPDLPTFSPLSPSSAFLSPSLFCAVLTPPQTPSPLALDSASIPRSRYPICCNSSTANSDTRCAWAFWRARSCSCPRLRWRFSSSTCADSRYFLRHWECTGCRICPGWSRQEGSTPQTLSVRWHPTPRLSCFLNFFPPFCWVSGIGFSLLCSPSSHSPLTFQFPGCCCWRTASRCSSTTTWWWCRSPPWSGRWVGPSQADPQTEVLRSPQLRPRRTGVRKSWFCFWFWGCGVGRWAGERVPRLGFGWRRRKPSYGLPKE